MSTARTVVGCIAEDFTEELAVICRIFAASKRAQADSGYALNSSEQRLLDVADSFVQSADQ